MLSITIINIAIIFITRYYFIICCIWSVYTRNYDLAHLISLRVIGKVRWMEAVALCESTHIIIFTIYQSLSPCCSSIAVAGRTGRARYPLLSPAHSPRPT